MGEGACGLCFDADGAIHWQQQRPLLDLCVSGDDQLLLYLPETATYKAVLSRDGRSLVLPPGKPVEVLDQDLLEVGGRRLCIHVHGVAFNTHPPRWLDLTPEPQQSQPQTVGRARAAATALAVGAALGAGACDDPKPHPPTKKTQQAAKKQTPPHPDARIPDALAPDAASLEPDAAPVKPDARIKRVIKRKKKIKVRIRPPVPLPNDDPLGGL